MTTTHRVSALAVAATTIAAATVLSAGPASAAAAPTITATIGTEYLSQTNAWAPVIAAKPGERLRVLVTYVNASPNAIERDVTAGVKLPKGVTLDGKVALTSALAAGKALPGAGFINRGARIGDYGPQANSYVVFFIRMPNVRSLRCGVTPLTVPLTERSGRATGTGTLHLHVHNKCPTSMTPVPLPG